MGTLSPAPGRHLPARAILHMLTSRVLAVAALLGTATLSPAQLAGSYLVGPGGAYPNIAAAITALTTSGVVAPVTFTVTASDTGPWTIPSFPGQGPTNPVVFDAVGTITLGGTQPVLTLNGCASVTFRGFSGQYTNTPSTFVIAGSTADCVFTNCNFLANVSTSGQALFSFTGGTGCRIEDSTFGGGYESLNSAVANANTTVQRCQILGGGFWIMRIAGTDFTLANNLITGNSNYGISCGVSGTPTSAANLKVWHNSIFINHVSTAAASQYCSLRWYSNAAGTEVVDNILVDNFPLGTGYNMWCSGSYRPTLMNYNCLYSNAATYFVTAASGNQTFATWQALGFDLNSIQADPLFVAPAATPPDLSLQPTSPCATAGTFLPAVLTDYALAPRTVPVSIGALEQDGGAAASYTVFGAGCAGTSGVPSNTISAPPQIGTSPTITFGNLPPPNIAIAVLGLSNTFAGAIPLPVDLAILGAPGCNARTSLDVTIGLAGVGGTASTAFPIANNPILIGFTFYTQALVLDPPLNAFGLSTSDAAVVVVGP